MDALTPSALLIETVEGVRLIGLNRPDRLNAINDAIRTGLPAALSEADADPAVKVIIIHGGPSRAFCVGADIKEGRRAETAIDTRSQMNDHHWIDAFERTRKPIIAAIHGYCMGGGAEIALACDIRIASSDAVFSLPETALGLIPGAGGTQRLPRVVGEGHAMDLVLTGDRIAASDALRIGLISRLVPERAELMNHANALAARIAARAPLATAFAKEALRAGADLTLAEGLKVERTLFAMLSTTDDKAEASRAFIEARAPVFRGT